MKRGSSSGFTGARALGPVFCIDRQPGSHADLPQRLGASAAGPVIDDRRLTRPPIYWDRMAVLIASVQMTSSLTDLVVSLAGKYASCLPSFQPWCVTNMGPDCCNAGSLNNVFLTSLCSSPPILPEIRTTIAGICAFLLVCLWTSLPHIRHILRSIPKADFMHNATAFMPSSYGGPVLYLEIGGKFQTRPFRVGPVNLCREAAGTSWSVTSDGSTE